MRKARCGEDTGTGDGEGRVSEVHVHGGEHAGRRQARGRILGDARAYLRARRHERGLCYMIRKIRLMLLASSLEHHPVAGDGFWFCMKNSYKY